MKLSVNRNTVWCDFFVDELYRNGVSNVCISPGSRSTPLTLAFVTNKKIKSYIIVDERSSGFFALGLAKKTKSPVAIVTTSGTAVAELYPSIIEAFYQRIPLIICTADRPPKLRDRGANQTINQNNIYRNHIRFFEDTGLPNLSSKKLNEFKNIINRGLLTGLVNDTGPIHFNMPFEKPFEPDIPTENFDINLIGKYSETIPNVKVEELTNNIDKIIDLIKNKEKGIILCGYNNFDKSTVKNIVSLSNHIGYPIIADGSSSLRFGTHNKKSVVNNFTSLIKSENFIQSYIPEIIIQFGGAPTSNIVQDYIKKSSAIKIIVNKFGDKNDPTLTAKQFIKIDENYFCKMLISKKINRASKWKNHFSILDLKVETIKQIFFSTTSINFEGNLIKSVLDFLPEKCNLMVSNSLPIRDLDFFAASTNKKINLFVNRGASGIDGINSTALGIAAVSNVPTILLTGDLAFYHDLNGLHNTYKYKIPLTVVLINNNGGGIFESLPISRFGNLYKENFVTSLNIKFANFVRAYNGEYFKIKSKKDLKEKLFESTRVKKFTLLEIITDSKKSKTTRNNYWQKVSKKINIAVNAIKN